MARHQIVLEYNFFIQFSKGLASRTLYFKLDIRKTGVEKMHKIPGL